MKPPARSWPAFVLVLAGLTAGCGIQIPLYRQCEHDAYCGHAYDPQDIYPDPTPHDIAGGDWIRGPLGMAEIRIHDPYRGWRPDPDEPEKTWRPLEGPKQRGGLTWPQPEEDLPKPEKAEQPAKVQE